MTDEDAQTTLNQCIGSDSDDFNTDSGTNTERDCDGGFRVGSGRSAAVYRAARKTVIFGGGGR